MDGIQLIWLAWFQAKKLVCLYLCKIVYVNNLKIVCTKTIMPRNMQTNWFNVSKHLIEGPFNRCKWEQVITDIARCYTPSIPEIIWVRNVRAIVVCGFLIESLKKHILKFWKKSWVPFGRYLLNSTANPAHFHSNWAGLAVLFSR